MPTSESAAAEEPVYRKVVWRIIPILFLCYIAAYLDRVNVGFAKLQMQSDLPQISDTVFGLAAILGAVGILISNLFRESTLVAMIGLTIAQNGYSGDVSAILADGDRSPRRNGSCRRDRLDQFPGKSGRFFWTFDCRLVQ
jgi:hypothetical protein